MDLFKTFFCILYLAFHYVIMDDEMTKIDSFFNRWNHFCLRIVWCLLHSKWNIRTINNFNWTVQYWTTDLWTVHKICVSVVEIDREIETKEVAARSHAPSEKKKLCIFYICKIAFFLNEVKFYSNKNNWNFDDLIMSWMEWGSGICTEHFISVREDK